MIHTSRVQIVCIRENKNTVVMDEILSTLVMIDSKQPAKQIQSKIEKPQRNLF